MVFITSMLFEMSGDPSKIEKLRLKLLSVALALTVLELFSIALGSIAKRNQNPEQFVYVSTYIIPLTYLFTFPIMYLLFLWSIFTPNWLLIRAKVIQPSFREYLNKK